VPEEGLAPAPPQRSLFRSIVSIVGGFVVLAIVGILTSMLLGAVAASEFPAGASPTTLGLALYVGISIPNGLVAGVLTGRLAGSAPIAHAAVLAGVIAWQSMMTSEMAQGMPGWFAIARVVVPAAAIVIGGAIVGLRAR
jgi:hypothetical protein